MTNKTRVVNSETHWPDDKKWLSDLLRLMTIGVIFLGLAIFLNYENGRDYQLLVNKYQLLLQGADSYGIGTSSLVFIMFAGLAISMGIPRLLISGIAGSIYGSLLGTILALAGSLIGATTVYLLGRSFLEKLINRWFNNHLSRWRRRFQDNTFWWVLFGRLFPFSNSTLISLLCGSCRVSFGAYLLASCVGFLPLTLVFATLANGGTKGDVNQVMLGFGLLLTAFLSRLLIQKKNPYQTLTGRECSQNFS